MPANVETMMYVREKPWHDIGIRVDEAPTSKEALTLAGLDWTVTQESIRDEAGEIIPGYRANVRSTDRRILGVVGERYKVVQNEEAFRFTDALIEGDVRYETAGSLKGGRQIWLLARLPKRTIADDDIDPYICFTNSHDGTGGVKVCMTPIRVVCSNTLNLALTSAVRSWSMKHTVSIHERLTEAKNCLFLANHYMDRLSEYGERAVEKKVDEEEIKEYLKELFPIENNASYREASNMEKCREEYWMCYLAPDLVKLRGTAWGAINAMSDFATHVKPLRQTENYAENNFGRILNGHALIDKMTQLCGVK